MTLLRTSVGRHTGHGGFRLEIPTTGCKPNSKVFASITETATGTGAPFLGAAILTINNVVPDVDKVLVRAEIGWQSDINVRVSVVAVIPEPGEPGFTR